ncbi:class I SAM-dependent RNA methyltransferase [Candidatus Saccharibacteria bacterium]|nr:class I SAM-dependent RNA methyltransferase [Candidatus Saccharibacteria bacterium]
MKYPKLLSTEINIEKLVPGGQGIGALEDGKKVFLWNVLPDETVTEFEVTKTKSHYLEGVVTKIKNPSKHRVAPKDACFLSTSPWQIFDFACELEQKQALVEESLRQEKLEGLNVESVRTDDKEWFYRNKMEYALYYDYDQSKILPAFHRRGTHGKIPIKNSSIERPEIFKKAKEIIDELNAKGEEARKYQSLLLRTNQNGVVSGGLFENKKPHPVFENLTDDILGREYSYSPNGFFQINLPVYELALKEIEREIKTEKVLDLYSGVGTIGLSVARNKRLTLVECDKSAFRELETNAKEARVKNATPIGVAPLLQFPRAFCAKSEAALDYIEPDETVILDPPRAGCDKKLLEKLLEETPEKIIYLSCNPSTQARDVKVLSEKYLIERIIPFDFFPKTPHIENLIILKKVL